MVKATLTLVIALIASVIGTPIQTKVRRRSVSNRIRSLNEVLQGSNRRSLQTLARAATNEVLGTALIDGTMQTVTTADAYQLYTQLNTPEERRRVLAPSGASPSSFGTCQISSSNYWPGNCERVDGESYTVCRSPATGLTHRRDSNCRAFPLNTFLWEDHSTNRKVAKIDGQLRIVTRAEAYDLLLSTDDDDMLRSVLAPKDHPDRDFGTCLIEETIQWPGNCIPVANNNPDRLSMCVVPSTTFLAFKTQGCINGDQSTLLNLFGRR